MSLTVAGGAMLGVRQPMNAPSTLGVRSLREEYAKPVNRADLPRNLAIVEECLLREPLSSTERVNSLERDELPRFAYMFRDGKLLPASVFIAALELASAETLNGRALAFDQDVLIKRDNLVAAYKPLVTKIRQVRSKEIDEPPLHMVSTFARCWTAFESAWLHNREVHAVEALQPLAKAILSLEPLLLSANKERLLPWPRVQHQKVVTLKCLEGFVSSLSELAGSVLPSLQRELDHDPRLLLLMDHVLALRGSPAPSCLQGVSSTPEVLFPDANFRPVGGPGGAPMDGSKGGLTLDNYAFKLLGSSVGDAVSAGRVHCPAPTGGRSACSLDVSTLAIASVSQKAKASMSAATPPRETLLNRRAAGHAAELLAAFEGVKDMLLSLKSTLEIIDPALDRDEAFVAQLRRFESGFRRAKRLFLEPDNLA